jgi:hypothetical protein
VQQITTKIQEMLQKVFHSVFFCSNSIDNIQIEELAEAGQVDESQQLIAVVDKLKAEKEQVVAVHLLGIETKLIPYSKKRAMTLDPFPHKKRG